MSHEWRPICRIDDIPRLGARVLKRTGHDDIAVFRNGDDKVFALVDRCPHQGGPLSQGIVHGERVTCPLHGWNIELGDGCAASPDTGCAQAFSVRCDGGTVYLLNEEIEPVSA